MVASFVDFAVYVLSLVSLLTYCHLLLQNVQDHMQNTYPKMINTESDGKLRAFLLEVVQEVCYIYQSLSCTKHQYVSSLSHLTKPPIAIEQYM